MTGTASPSRKVRRQTLAEVGGVPTPAPSQADLLATLQALTAQVAAMQAPHNPLPPSANAAASKASTATNNGKSAIVGTLAAQVAGWTAELRRLYPVNKMKESAIIDGKTYRYFDENGQQLPVPCDDGQEHYLDPTEDLKNGKVQPIAVHPVKRRYFAEATAAKVLGVEIVAIVQTVDTEGKVQEQQCIMGDLEFKRFSGGNVGFMGDLTLDYCMPDGQRIVCKHNNDCFMLDKVMGSINDNG